MSDETTLLPCPFCGGEAQVMSMDLGDIEEGWKVWGVWCVDDLNAEDYRSHGHFIDNCATEAEAIAVWNARASLGSGTCELEYVDTYEYPDGEEDYLCKCSKCGRKSWEPAHNLPKFCGGCGRMVKR